MKRQTIIITISIFILALYLGGCTATPILLLHSQDGPLQLTQGEVKTHPMRGDTTSVDNATTILITDNASATMNFNTVDLVPGHIYTAWWVIFNNPTACEGPCDASDVFGNTEKVQADLIYADGQIADEQGQAAFSGTLYASEISDTWFGNGLPNPRRTEIHIVLHDHGEPIAGLEAEMLSTWRAGCTDASLPTSFPDVAFADGTPGSNECIHYQFTVFEQ